MENREQDGIRPGITKETSVKDKIFVLIALLLGFLLVEFILSEGFGLSVPAFMIVFYGAVFWYLSGRPGGIDSKGLPLLLPIALLTACFGLFDNQFLSALDFLILFALVIFQLATMTGNRLYGTFSVGLLIDFFHAGIVLPLANIPTPFRVLKRKSSEKANRLNAILIGLAISVPLLLIVLSLLSSADIIFEKGLGKVFEFLNRHIAEYIFKIIFGAIIAVPLYGLLHALYHGERIQTMKLRIDFGKFKLLDEGVAVTVLGLLNVVYLVFIAVQFGYLFNAFSSILPENLTYAEYARRGFFQLMGVSLINLCVLSVSMLFSKRSSQGAAVLKGMETALVALTLLLIASAMAKMFMYMDTFGLTLLRVYVSWFLLLCAVVFSAMLLKLYIPKFALVRFCTAAFLVLYLALNFGNVDGWIARYNIDQYQAGKFKTVDVEMFYDLSDSMVPYAAELLDDRDAAVADNAKKLLSGRASILRDNRWQVFSLARSQAASVLRSKGFTEQPGAEEPMD